MCYRKTLRRNVCKSVNLTSFDKAYIHTPCCKCPACRKQRSADWLVRSYYEFKYGYPSRQAFFITLDFDNQHLPIYEIGKGLISSMDRMFIHDFRHLPDGYQACFDSEEIKSFLHRLRYYIGEFRYFISTDYGGALKRPHYHMVCFPKNCIDKISFFQAVEHCWPNGKYEDLELLSSIDSDRLKCIKYISQYTTKDVTFDLDDKEKHLPMRFRSRVHVSSRFGICAIEDCSIGDDFITKDMILHRKPLSLPLGKNGKILKYKIPRYYELKYTHDYSWNREFKYATLKKNEFGILMSKFVHNEDYVFVLRSFFASRNDRIVNYYHLLDDTPYVNMKWHDVVLDIMSDYQDFKEFVYHRDFLSRTADFLILNVKSNSFSPGEEFPFDKPMIDGYVCSRLNVDEYYTPIPIYRPRWKLYNDVMSVFDKYKAELDANQDRIETDNLIRSAKYRELEKIGRDAQKRAYLERIGYDFSQLY